MLERERVARERVTYEREQLVRESTADRKRLLWEREYSG